jgi:hypothetical protein
LQCFGSHNFYDWFIVVSFAFHSYYKDLVSTAAFTLMDMPRGFSQPGKVLKLNRSRYGLKQSPQNFFQHLEGKLEDIGFESAEAVDPCLFISDKVIYLVYVDDTLFYSPRQEYIDEVIQQLQEQGMDLEVKGSVAGFLAVHIECNHQDDSIKLMQPGLAK